MNELLSSRVRAMAASATLAMAAKAAELKAQGLDIISLSLGEPDFPPPQFVIDAAKEALDGDWHKYSPVNGYKDLREAICRKLERDNRLSYTAEQIVVSTGAKQCLANLALVLVDEGDEVLLPAPYWVSYADLIKLAGGIPIELPTSVETDFKVSPEQLAAAITPRTKMMWFSSPCNPSGSVYSQEELEGLGKVLRQHPDIYIVSDEIYEHISFEDKHTSIASIEGLYDRTVTVNGVSKAFAMTGWRIGYLAAPISIAEACTKMQGQITSGANSVAQRATIAALDAPIEHIGFMIDEFRARRDLVLEGLAKIEGLKLNKPQGAFYIFVDVSAFFGKVLQGIQIDTADDMSMYLLEKALVATVSGTAFGSPKCIRLSYATDQETLTEAVERIRVALSL
ncbi:MAG: pyridoxal phosphate-dependent aminotransferase [Porphyromonadaceae bacterium]|nr:pyridoxal phosphate-dependent aminotransferase [Porphyromonadaceae bacterium]